MANIAWAIFMHYTCNFCISGPAQSKSIPKQLTLIAILYRHIQSKFLHVKCAQPESTGNNLFKLMRFRDQQFSLNFVFCYDQNCRFLIPHSPCKYLFYYTLSYSSFKNPWEGRREMPCLSPIQNHNNPIRQAEQRFAHNVGI